MRKRKRKQIEREGVTITIFYGHVGDSWFCGGGGWDGVLVFLVFILGVLLTCYEIIVFLGGVVGGGCGGGEDGGGGEAGEEKNK